jgi:anaerobic selenocysteine-containing dehydrogenase
MKTADKKVSLHIEEMFSELNSLADEATMADDIDGNTEYPFILMAGERRSYNANQIFRTPDWRKTDKDGAMRVHSDDLAQLGLQDKDKAVCRSEVGQIEVLLMQDDTVQPGMVTLPHGYGMLYSNSKGQLMQNGPAVNELTSAAHCDPIAKTPYHKHVAVAIEPISV